MTSKTSRGSRGWRRRVTAAAAAGSLAAGVLVGLGVSTAFAAPDDQTTQTPAPVADGPPKPCTGADCGNAEPTPTMTADQALSIIATEYDTGAGGGQISNMIHDIMRLRSQGFRPSNANRLAIEQALDKRPNQAPLIEALKSTLTYQKKLKAQAENAVKPPAPAAVAVGPTPGPMPAAPGVPQPAPGVGITGPGGNGIVMPIG
jgi:hypothetical protein